MFPPISARGMAYRTRVHFLIASGVFESIAALVSSRRDVALCVLAQDHSQRLERHRLATVVAIDFEDDVALPLGLLTGGVGGLGFHYYPPQGNDNRPSDLMALALRSVTHWSILRSVVFA